MPCEGRAALRLCLDHLFRRKLRANPFHQTWPSWGRDREYRRICGQPGLDTRDLAQVRRVNLAARRPVPGNTSPADWFSPEPQGLEHELKEIGDSSRCLHGWRQPARPCCGRRRRRWCRRSRRRQRRCRSEFRKRQQRKRFYGGHVHGRFILLRADIHPASRREQRQREQTAGSLTDQRQCHGQSGHRR